MSKVAIKIELNNKEDAIVYYEKTLGQNITIQKRASVLYYASKGAESITELHKSCGIKHSALDSVEDKLLEEFEKNPPSSIPEAVSRIKEKFGITLTDTPVRYWLRKKGFVTSNQNRYRRKQT